MKTYASVIIIALAAVSGGIYFYKTGTENVGGVFCTMEAKICPDGSAVGRTGPKCEFAECPRGVTYKNTEYGLSVVLPLSWQGYTVSIDKWKGNASGDQLGDVAVADGPVVSIHNPKWTGGNTYQDVPIMIFTISEWNNLQTGKFHIGAEPVNPSELARNSKYVFALPVRYNYGYPEGFQEVEQIIAGKSVTAFEPNGSSGTVSPGALRAVLGQKVSGLNVTLTPLEVTEDSRCPAGVQCVWAGTVKVRTKIESGLGESTMILELGKPITTEAEEITLKEATPEPEAGVKINNGDYAFQFEVRKRKSVILPITSGVRGTVLLGPTCPVMRDPPDPKCADKPYATTITVRREGSGSVFATGKSNDKGVFEFSLPPGSYVFSAEGGKMLPRCNETKATVSLGEYSDVAISCDTGIR